MIDTRLITAAQDAKAGGAALDSDNPSPEAARAAFDDGRCKLHELLTETIICSPRDKQSISNAYDLLNEATELTGDAYNGYALMCADTAIGILTRIADRWTT